MKPNLHRCIALVIYHFQNLWLTIASEILHVVLSIGSLPEFQCGVTTFLVSKICYET